MKFKNSEEYQDILSEALHSGTLNKEATFTCYVDQIFNYEVQVDKYTKQVFSIISRYSTFLPKLEVEDMLNLKGIKYFNNYIWKLKTNGQYRLLDSRTFNSTKKATLQRKDYLKSIQCTKN